MHTTISYPLLDGGAGNPHQGPRSTANAMNTMIMLIRISVVSHTVIMTQYYYPKYHYWYYYYYY